MQDNEGTIISTKLMTVDGVDWPALVEDLKLEVSVGQVLIIRRASRNKHISILYNKLNPGLPSFSDQHTRYLATKLQTFSEVKIFFNNLLIYVK